MFELSGKYGKAKVFTDICDQESIAQIINLLNQPYAEEAHVRMMPDVHAGAGCTIGTTMKIYDRVCPNLVGVDIGCGMEAVQIAEKDIDFERLDAVIHEHVPAGFNIRQTPHKLSVRIDLTKLRCAANVDVDRAYKSIGTLGGGNHFIELNADDDDNYYLVIHSGSRHLGIDIAKHYQGKAWEGLTRYSKQETDLVIQQLKNAGRHSEIQDTLKAMKEKECHIPKELAYVSGQAFHDYLHDMKIAQTYADLNRHAITDTIVEQMGWTVVNTFTTIHNYIDVENLILRKGAVSAQTGEKLIIPINMRDGSLICTGLGNLDWNCSAPHGAGRLFSRNKAKEMFSVEEFKQEMEGIYTTSVNQNTLDESPMAYKRIEDILSNISETVQVDKVIKPVYNFKAGN